MTIERRTDWQQSASGNNVCSIAQESGKIVDSLRKLGFVSVKMLIVDVLLTRNFYVEWTTMGWNQVWRRIYIRACFQEIFFQFLIFKSIKKCRCVKIRMLLQNGFHSSVWKLRFVKIINGQHGLSCLGYHLSCRKLYHVRKLYLAKILSDDNH